MVTHERGVVELRSDTFTRPTAAMRRAMAGAEVGDDVWGEDPTVHRLEEEVARRLGKEAAVLLPSGTMANLCGVACHTAPGDEVILDRLAHIANHEAAGAAVVCGVQLRTLDPASGIPGPDEVDAAVRPADPHAPRSRLLCLENTHNGRGGGAVPAERIAAAAAAAHRHGLRVHHDGARLFNAAVALGADPATLVAACDTVMVSLSKGLGAPVGSVLAGDADSITRARQWRKRLGGGMRQAGILAAAGLHALEHHVERLRDDHEHARLLADGLDGVAGIRVLRVPVPTNMVMFETAGPASEVVARAAEHGVRIAATGTHRIRCVTHLDVDREGALRAAEVIAAAVGDLAPVA